MNNPFSRVRSFKNKLMLMTTSIIFVVLLVATASLTYVLERNFKSNLDQSTRASLAILAYNLAPAVTFGESDEVEQLLSSFNTSDDVVHASVYALDEEKQLTFLAEYSTDPEFKPNMDVRAYLAGLFVDDHFQVTQPITVENEVIGYLYQYSVFSQLGEFQTQMLIIFGATSMICLFIGMLMSFRAQKVLLAPLAKLIQATRKISQTKNFAIRVDVPEEEEFSALSKNFNQMLDEIESHHQKQLAVEAQITQLNLDLENKVTQRTSELEGANKYLKNTLSKLEHSTNQLVEQEKMASLGGLVAGIAHEINTPLGISVTAISHLNHLVANLQQKFEDKSLTTSFMHEIIAEITKGTDISIYNLKRASDIISNFKLIAVDQSSDLQKTFFLNAYIHEVVLSLTPALKKLNHDIKILCDQNLQVHCRAGALVQILTNLIMNSILHGFEHMEKGQIDISAHLKDDKVHLTYQDNGAGMSESQLSRLFEPFFTTKRGKGGSGLGAHLVYNLVSQGLNGKISASSKVGEGLTFDIEFPANQDAIVNEAVSH